MATDFNRNLLGYKACFEMLSLIMNREIVLEISDVHRLITCYTW